jgi:glycosyltransferase involved in cell wall biosynthesis
MTRLPLRVLHVLSTLSMGGAETWLMSLLKHWRETGEVEMDFLLTGHDAGVFDAQAQALGAQLHRLPYGRSDLATFVPAFRALLAREGYDAIHDHSDYAGGVKFALGLGRLPAVRVAHVHNPYLHITANYGVTPTRRLAAEIGKRLVNILATDVLGTSGEILHEYGFEAKGGGPRVKTVHCGFDIDRFSCPRAADRTAVLESLGWPAATKLVLFAGRLDRALSFEDPQNHKNSWFALNVARQAMQIDAALRMIVAGEGASRGLLTEKVAEWGLSDRIVFLGIRQDIDRLMRAADILLFPSRQEGLGMVAVEAQACGLPVLASDAVPAEACVIPELFHALPLSASVETWASALLQGLTAPRLSISECREALAQSAFSIENSAASLLRIYGGGR